VIAVAMRLWSEAPTPVVIPARELHLIRLAADLGAADFGGPLSVQESHLLDGARKLPATEIEEIARIVDEIRAGGDPLGDLFCATRAPVERRAQGAFYTPAALVDPMVAWTLTFDPQRVVDAGCGSGRFAAAVARYRPDLPIVAVDLDPVATILARATLLAAGATSVRVLQADYTSLDLPVIEGKTAFIGNPPYVRHHDLSPDAKVWAAGAAGSLGLQMSGLSGLHVYFYLATALYARPGDVGCFVTSSEWLDVNYGSLLRKLFLGRLGGQSLHLVDQRTVPFDDAMTTALIACFVVGSAPPYVRLQMIQAASDLDALIQGEEVLASRLRLADRWTPVIGNRNISVDATAVPLRKIARVHRGVVTGSNSYFIMTRQRSEELGLSSWCRPAITRGSEIMSSDGVIRDAPGLLVVLDVPPDVDRTAHPRLDAYLRTGETGTALEPPIANRYIPAHRRPWWFLGHWTPPPIVASYMARQGPHFALNPDGLAIINVVHGIYPHRSINFTQLEELVVALNTAREGFRGHGRTYHGGLEKFEPREMEALPVPFPDLSQVNSFSFA
jgi:adenine-specific DNA-methyltransferase